MIRLKKYTFSILMFIIFETIAITLWLTLDNAFYLFNFTYIGVCLSVGGALFAAKVRFGRIAVQLAIGSYMLVYLGIISRENMMLDGFWYYLFLGVFEAATIHYAVAKIFGPLIFARGWCGYACWTAMLLDLLPYKVSGSARKSFGYIRYILFILSLLFVAALFVFKAPGLERIMFWSFLIGNVLYYGIGVSLAFLLKDNRAFCKYICPITVFLKPASYFSLLRIKNDQNKCVHCGLCQKSCPMNVDMTDNSRKRKNGTECILCLQCIDSCPQKSLRL